MILLYKLILPNYFNYRQISNQIPQQSQSKWIQTSSNKKQYINNKEIWKNPFIKNQYWQTTSASQPEEVR